MSGRISTLCAVGAMLVSLPSLYAADEPKTEEPAPMPTTGTEKMIHLSTKYKEVGEVVSEVFKVDSTSLTIRVTWYTMPTTGAGRTNFGHWSHGSNSRNPQQMYQHMMQMQQAMARQASRKANVKPQEHHQDYTFSFAEDARARAKHMPVRLDDKGKRIPYTPEELKEAKANVALSGYERPLDGIKVGSIVELHLGKMYGAPKDKKDDLYIRWVYILDESTVKAQKPDTTLKNTGSKN